MSLSTITLQKTYDWAQPFLPKTLNIGAVGNQPVLGSANMVLQRFLSPPFAWGWNRATATFTLSTNVTDYEVDLSISSGKGSSTGTSTFTYTSGTTFSSSWIGGPIDINGTTYTVLTVPGSTLTVNGTIPAATGVTFTVGGGLFGFIEKATVTQSGADTMEIPEIQLNLGSGTETGRPQCIAPYIEKSNGHVVFRVSPAPSSDFNNQTVTVIYQIAPPTITALTGIWSPLPDKLSLVYQTGFQYYMLMYSNDPADRTLAASVFQDFVGQLLAVSEGLDQTQKDEFKATWLRLGAQEQAAAIKPNLGAQARTR